jgi:hypothetical protein
MAARALTGFSHKELGLFPFGCKWPAAVGQGSEWWDHIYAPWKAQLSCRVPFEPHVTTVGYSLTDRPILESVLQTVLY